MGHGDVMLVHWAATYFFSFPLPTYYKWQKLWGDMPLNCALVWRFLNQGYDGKGLVVDGCQPLAKPFIWLMVCLAEKNK